MRRRSEELEAAGIAVLVVSFEARERVRAYRDATGLAFPVLLDQTRRLYRGYAMDRAGFFDLWGPATWLAYARELLAGGRPGPGGGDTGQRGGDVLLDPAGIVRLHHVGAGPGDRPGIETLLRVVRGPGAPGGG